MCAIQSIFVKTGWNIDLKDPNNNIVDNFGLEVAYLLNGSNGFYYNYYLGERDFIRSKDKPFNAPYNGFNPKGWYYMPIETSGLNLLGTFNDADSRFIPSWNIKMVVVSNRPERYHDMTLLHCNKATFHKHGRDEIVWRQAFS